MVQTGMRMNCCSGVQLLQSIKVTTLASAVSSSCCWQQTCMHHAVCYLLESLFLFWNPPVVHLARSVRQTCPHSVNQLWVFTKKDDMTLQPGKNQMAVHCGDACPGSGGVSQLSGSPLLQLVLFVVRRDCRKKRRRALRCPPRTFAR